MPHPQGGQDSTEGGQVQVTLTTGVSKVRGKEVSEPQPHIWAPAHALRSVLLCVLSNDNILICFSAKETYWLIYQSSPRVV